MPPTGWCWSRVYIVKCLLSVWTVFSDVLVNRFAGEVGRLWFMVFANFCSVNTLIVADFSSGRFIWCHQMWSWQDGVGCWLLARPRFRRWLPMSLLSVFLSTASLLQFLEGDYSFPFILSTLWLCTELLFWGMFFVFWSLFTWCLSSLELHLSMCHLLCTVSTSDQFYFLRLELIERENFIMGTQIRKALKYSCLTKIFCILHIPYLHP